MLSDVSTIDMAVRVLLALGLGALLGLERERHDKPAGLKTHILVTLGAAGFGLIASALTAAALTSDPAQALNPASRVIQGVIGGVGFLGAGAILHMRGHVIGLTTAANMWMAAAIGLAVGLGLFVLALLLSAGAMIGLLASRVVERRIHERAPLGDAAARGADDRADD